MKSLWYAAALAIVIALTPGKGIAEKKLDASSLSRHAEQAKSTEAQAVTSLGECQKSSDENVRKICKELEVKFLRHQGFSLDHRKSSLSWQLSTSKVIFAVVLLLVAVGVYFSWRHFSASLKQPSDEEVSSIELSAGGIKISSPVIGLIILTLSLGFFYLYLVHVYPITEIK